MFKFWLYDIDTVNTKQLSNCMKTINEYPSLLGTKIFIPVHVIIKTGKKLILENLKPSCLGNTSKFDNNWEFFKSVANIHFYSSSQNSG